jgi:hypothetical protein
MAGIHQHCKQMFGFLLKFLFFKIMKFAILWAHDSHTKKLIEDFSMKELQFKKNQCHITCLILKSFDFIFLSFYV